jgi:hypothetical protein
VTPAQGIAGRGRHSPRNASVIGHRPNWTEQFGVKGRGVELAIPGRLRGPRIDGPVPRNL